MRSPLPVEDFDAVLVNARKLLRAARTAPAMVVHAAYRRDFAAVPPRPLEPTTPDGRPTFSDKDSPLTAICPEVEPVDGEPVLWKNDASVFSDGRLELLLRGIPAEWLIVAGVWTGLLLSVHIRQLVNFAGTMNFVIFRMFFVSSALYRSGKCRSQAGGRALQVGGPRLRLAAWAGGPAPRGTRCQGLDGLPRRVATPPGR